MSRISSQRSDRRQVCNACSELNGTVSQFSTFGFHGNSEMSPSCAEVKSPLGSHGLRETQSHVTRGFRKSLRFYTAAISLLMALAAHLGLARASTQSHSSTQTPFELANENDFKTYKEKAIEYLQAQNWRRATSMCALGESLSGENHVWFVWRDGRKIILWDEPSMPLATSRRIIKIPQDVVAKKSDVRGSTYKVTKAWVQDLTTRCAKNGTLFQVPAQSRTLPK